MPPLLQRHFLSWDQPWLPQVAGWLAQDWQGRGPLDLSDVMAIVPTNHSGRRLREALAEHAAARGAAVFAPRVCTPDTLLAKGAAASDVASRLEAWLAWTDVLLEVDMAEVGDVFPAPPKSREFSWSWRIAESFGRLQTQLNESGLALADVLARAGAEFPEAARWRQLAHLEELQRAKLEALGRREPHAARREFARAPALPEGITRVVLLAAPDPLPLALEVLRAWASQVRVDVVVWAPAHEAAAFDEWGRPRPPAWTTRVIALSEFDQRVHLCADPAAEAECVAGIAGRHAPDADGLVALGVADAEVLPMLERELARVGVTGYNPEGRARRGERLHGLLAALGALAREPSFDAIAALARCPDFLAMLAGRFGRDFSASRFLKDLDDTRSNHLPADLAALRRIARGEVQRVLPVLDELRGVLEARAFPANASAALALIFDHRRLNLAAEEGAQAVEAAEAWRGVMQECARARALFPALAPPHAWEIALRLFGDERRTEDKPPGALDLQGWLELLWEDAPHLVVAGLNDGVVPDAIVGDAFLPETLRERLGLKTNLARFARDAYILQAIAAARRGAGTQLDLLYAKASSIGEPLRPSRLLLRCEEAALPARVALLFRATETARGNLPWTRAWKLALRRAPPPPRVAVTGLRAWLACPFRFYLSHVLRMEPVEPAKNELDARDFGTLCHTALEAMALEPALRDTTDEKLLREFLLARLDATAHERFGENFTLPLVVQFESARQRLAHAAAVHARDRAEGWRTERAEWKLTLDLGGLEVRGKIDRVDRHESGAWRVLDYKTADSATLPARAHLRPFRKGDERRPEWMRVTLGSRDYVWADLQLPLYVRALEPEAGRALTTGYFNLPKAVGETAISLWDDLGGELFEAACRCADGVAAAIRAGEFWPPTETPMWDGFTSLFHHGAAESVDWPAAAETPEKR